MKEKLQISCLRSFWNSSVQTAMISKPMIKFWSKFHIQILWYSFTRDNRCRVTPSQSLSGKQENPFSSASRHINNSFSVYLFLDSELNNGRIKVQVKRPFESKRVFESCFFSTTTTTTTTKHWENRHALHEIFFNLQYKCVELPIPPNSKSILPFSATLSFSKNVSTLRSGSTKW